MSKRTCRIRILQPPEQYEFRCGCRRHVAEVIKNGRGAYFCPVHGKKWRYKITHCRDCRAEIKTEGTKPKARCEDCWTAYQRYKNRKYKQTRLTEPGRKYASVYHKKPVEIVNKYVEPEAKKQEPLLHSWADLNPAVDRVLDKYKMEA